MSKPKIRLTCTCQRRFRAKPGLAGKTVKCPGCGTALLIPVPETETYELGASRSKTENSARKVSSWAGQDVNGPPVAKTWEPCPGCSGPVVSDSVICTNCGYNLRTGEPWETTERASSEVFWWRLAPAVLVVFLVAALIQTQLTGIQFLFVFLWFCGVATTIGAEFQELGKGRACLVCLAAWECLGLVRLVYGLSIGMQTVRVHEGDDVHRRRSCSGPDIRRSRPQPCRRLVCWLQLLWRRVRRRWLLWRMRRMWRLSFLLVVGRLAPDSHLAEVTPDDDDFVVAHAGFFQSGDHVADLSTDVTRAGEVTVQQRS